MAVDIQAVATKYYQAARILANQNHGIIRGSA